MVLAQQTFGLLDTLIVLLYLMIIGYLAWIGYKKTQNAKDYLIAGGKTHPFIMAMSYGAAFISTSALVGFAGVAGMFGMSVLWLTVLNIFVGIFIAFVFFGGRTRRMAHHLGAHTFPELLSRRYDSKFIQIFAGLIIFIFMPLYAAAALIGGCEFIHVHFDIDYNVALFVFSVIIALYVVMGGLKGVMYAEALQGSIMFISMLILLVYSYYQVGGVTEGHRTLTGMAEMVPGPLKAMGHQGWTSFPKFGFGDNQYNLWWIVVTTIIMGVGIGVLAQPQLIVRFMTVKSQNELNRACILGGLFILFIPGTAFVVANLSNVFFINKGDILNGRVVKTLDQEKGYVLAQLMKKDDDGKWVDIMKKNGKPAMASMKLDSEQPNTGDAVMIDAKATPVVRGRTIAIGYAKSIDKIMPTFIGAALPKWFGLLFLLTLLAAAMSTLSGQFHALGASLGRDVYEQVTGHSSGTIGVSRIAIIIGIIIAVMLGYYARGGYVIARATAIFFGICASTFLPAFAGGLFTKRVTRKGAKASMIVGLGVTVFWLVFIKAKEAGAIGLVQKITDGKPSLLWDQPNWPVVDPIVIALPLSIITLIVVSMITKDISKEHVENCFSAPEN